MNEIRLLDLGLVSPLRSQTIYHAVGRVVGLASGRLAPDTIILVAPNRPYVCVGYHQDLEREVDLAYCREHGLPVYRREVGGGAVYLDAGQLFVQWIFRREGLPAGLEARFALYAAPLVETYRALGVPAYHRPVNDIHTSDVSGRARKIGGTGAAQMGEAEVLVGSLMFTFDKATMARVLKVSSEKMRDKVYQSLDLYMTTLAEQLDPLPQRDTVRDLYLEHARAALGRDILPGELSPEELDLAADLDAQFAEEAWLYQKGERVGGGLYRPGVKIHEDVHVMEGAHKAPGGLVRCVVRIRDGRVDALELTGDFTMLPATAVGELEQVAVGAAVESAELVSRFVRAYQELSIEAPGLTPEDVAASVLAAASGTGV